MGELTELQLFWSLVLCFSLLMYLVLDGFDLGVGILFGFTRDALQRDSMMDSIAPVWDGNETWLIVVGAGLYAVFPGAYAIFFSALYLPIVLLLIALIFRGVAFEFRYRSKRHRWFWDGGFFVGSLVVAFVQGAGIGALIEEFPVENGQFAGDALTWLSPFSILTGLGLVVGYTLHGCTWLAVKTSGDLRERVYRLMPILLVTVAIILISTFCYTWIAGLDLFTRWQNWGRIWLFPLLTIMSIILMWWAMQRRKDYLLFSISALLIVSAFSVLAASFAPYIIPFSLTIADAASTESALLFLFWGAGLFALPIILVYTITVYWMFRGRVC